MLYSLTLKWLVDRRVAEWLKPPDAGLCQFTADDAAAKLVYRKILFRERITPKFVNVAWFRLPAKDVSGKHLECGRD